MKEEWSFSLVKRFGRINTDKKHLFEIVKREKILRRDEVVSFL